MANILVPEVTLQVSDWGVPTAGTPVAAAYNVVAPMTDAEDITMAIQSSVSQTTHPIFIQPRRVGQPMTAASYANQYVLGVDNRADASLRALSAPREASGRILPSKKVIVSPEERQINREKAKLYRARRSQRLMDVSLANQELRTKLNFKEAHVSQLQGIIDKLTVMNDIYCRVIHRCKHCHNLMIGYGSQNQPGQEVASSSFRPPSGPASSSTAFGVPQRFMP